ncbi:MAG: ArsR/SmtB family transcription factor [Acidimicrobiales bacterium]
MREPKNPGILTAVLLADACCPSHHLKVLAEAGLIVGEKRGRWAWYRAVPERLVQLRAILE